MRVHLKRYYGTRALHFITFSCYRRQPFLSVPSVRDIILQVLEETRQRYDFAIVGYVLMPEHVHLLMNEPAIGDPSVAMRVPHPLGAKRRKGGVRRAMASPPVG